MKKRCLISLSVVAIIVVVALLFWLRPKSEAGVWLCQDGQWVQSGESAGDKPTGDCQVEPPTMADKADLIIVDQPSSNQAVSSPLVVKGQARGTWFFEGVFPIKITGSDGQVIAVGQAQAQSSWQTEDFVPFEATIEFNVPDNTLGVLLLQKDNPSGLAENNDELLLPILLQTTASATMPIKVYWTTDKTGNDPDFNCQDVQAATRQITKTKETGRAALEQLLQGPNVEEKQAGFKTSLNAGVKLQSLSINQGIAKADFDQKLEQGVGGSCRVASISAQIKQTLLQFPSVQEVVISINGRTEDILQP